MKELLDKISSYNIFNFLLPGIVFVVLANQVIGIGIAITQRDLIVAAFLYYFVGLVISRFGSLVIEPLLRLCSFVRFVPYDDFVAAEKKDPKLTVLLEVNNTYRTLCALFVLLLLLKGYVRLATMIPALRNWQETALVVLLLILFLFSHRKQTAYIVKRVRANL
jgi:hypothetical protein